MLHLSEAGATFSVTSYLKESEAAISALEGSPYFMLGTPRGSSHLFFSAPSLVSSF